MSTHTPGDIVTARDGSKWRVIAVERTVVRAEHIATGVTSHFPLDALRSYEPYPKDET